MDFIPISKQPGKIKLINHRKALISKSSRHKTKPLTKKEVIVEKPKQHSDFIRRQRLLLRFRNNRKIDEKVELEILSLHPGIVKITYPRRVRNWCFINFSSEEKTQEAFKLLKKINTICVSEYNEQDKIKRTRKLVDKKETRKELLNRWL